MPVYNRIWASTLTLNVSTAGNWLPASVPATGDSVFLTNNSIGMDPSLATLGATTLATFNQDMSFTGPVGTFTGFVVTYMTVTALIINLGLAAPTSNSGGSSQIYLDAAANTTTVNILDSSRSGSGFLPPIVLKGTVLTVNAQGGAFGVGLLPNETSTLVALNMTVGFGDTNNSLTGYLGVGVTVNALTMQAGTLYSASTVTMPSVTLMLTAQLYLNAAVTVTALNINSAKATVVVGATTTITNCTCYGTLDLSQGVGAVTFTNAPHFKNGSRILDPNKRAVFPVGGFDITDGTIADVTINLGYGRSYTAT